MFTLEKENKEIIAGNQRNGERPSSKNKE